MVESGGRGPGVVDQARGRGRARAGGPPLAAAPGWGWNHVRSLQSLLSDDAVAAAMPVLQSRMPGHAFRSLALENTSQSSPHPTKQAATGGGGPCRGQSPAACHGSQRSPVRRVCQGAAERGHVAVRDGCRGDAGGVPLCSAQGESPAGLWRAGGKPGRDLSCMPATRQFRVSENEAGVVRRQGMGRVVHAWNPEAGSFGAPAGAMIDPGGHIDTGS